MQRPAICIVTPALADAGNGNWRTARRWAGMLASDFRVELSASWQGGDARLLIALHARRSADSIRRWAEQMPHRPLVVVLTGTDVYRDIHRDESARRSLQLADRLVVLQERALDELAPEFRDKAIVCHQSTPERSALAKTNRHLRALMVGHLREEKDPQTYFDAAALLGRRDDIRLDHVGSALDESWAAKARAARAAWPRYRWLGPLDHAATLARIRRAHVLVHPSRMEGGAHVVMEAVRCGTPVLASRIPGNVGLLGEDYPGYFAVGDATALAAGLERCRDDEAFLPELARHCAARSPLFDPLVEKATLQAMVSSLLARSDGER
ncbi:MAG TPA: selenoneine biosynthesis selenosugar synthase SenB [Caldimonas sp.]|nr:selenoneine biosynthesis selenosugar synthase SenB [Caldimonas sp.]